jgi:hypothetical protein
VECVVQFSQLKRRQGYDKSNASNRIKRLQGCYLSHPSLLKRGQDNSCPNSFRTSISEMPIDKDDTKHSDDNLMIDRNLIYSDRVVDLETGEERLDVDRSFSNKDDTVETCDKQASRQVEMSLHHYTRTSTFQYCESFTELSRKARLCKAHTDGFLSFIKSGLPIPNNMPSTSKDLVALLDVDELFTKRCICLTCERSFDYAEKICSLCRSTETTSVAHVYVTPYLDLE